MRRGMDSWMIWNVESDKEDQIFYGTNWEILLASGIGVVYKKRLFLCKNG